MVREAIILAGGLGTRLREIVPDLPKCMAPVAGKPFLFYVINYLRSQGVEKFIFSLGYKYKMIEQYLAENFSTLNYQYTIEEEPLGTGGAILLACRKATEKMVLVANGDTLYKANLQKAATFHSQLTAECTLLLKPMTNFERYGVVETNEENRVTCFREKQYFQSGNINGGLYLLETENFSDFGFPNKFSFEKDYLEKYYNHRKIYGITDDSYFIDIGVPEDFKKAQTDLARPKLDLTQIDKTWTLFIDRDGVINHEKKTDYILNWNEFSFYEGVLDSFRFMAEKFGRIIIVSNQRGVGRGLMTESGLRHIHDNMQEAIQNSGGRIDKIYYCTSTDNKHPDRKPNPGMAFHAKKEFPDIDFSKSIMIGNKMSDMLFAKNAGMYSIFLATTDPHTPYPHPDIDLRFSSLHDFVNHL